MVYHFIYSLSLYIQFITVYTVYHCKQFFTVYGLSLYIQFIIVYTVYGCIYSLRLHKRFMTKCMSYDCTFESCFKNAEENDRFVSGRYTVNN